ncbi:MAG: ester cyclase [Chloroflexota bacterium]|nr:ester cyclase [Chloroflexota bacterium]
MAEDKKASNSLDVKRACDEEKARITLPNKLDIQFMEDARGNQAQSMRGFNPRYKDFVDYIIGITHEIWEEKGIGKLYDYYANTIHLHTSYGTSYGREPVFAATIAAMAAFPDRRLYGDEVIWGGNDVDGLYSSHRLRHEGTNRGWTKYGPPTGKRVSYWSMADCFIKRNMVVEEWICRDELTLVLQLGLDPVETAREMAAREKDSDMLFQIPGDIERGIGQFPPERWPEPQSERFDPEDFVKRMLHEIWNWRLLNKAQDYYHEQVVFAGPTRRAFKGISDLQTYALNVLSPFPDLAIRADHFCYVGDEKDGYRTATRWTMRGTHTGYGIYGEPTGNPIEIIGISHHVIVDGQVVKEWTVFDEFALLMQIYA